MEISIINWKSSDQIIRNFHQDRGPTYTSMSETRLNGKLRIIRKGGKWDCIVYSKKKEKDGRLQTND